MTEGPLDVPVPQAAGSDPYAFGAVTPARALTAAVGGGFTVAAASFQQQTSTLAAVARVTHQPIGQLSADIRQLARDFPIGTQAAIATVSAVQQLGLSARDQVPQIAALSRVMTTLGGAVGESPAVLATNFGQLNRQLASLDPSRVARFGDVLTTLTARSGASAMGILAFSRQIAPVAQQAGLGESAVLGIASAFAKLGDDGTAAATAVNRILTDLNSSVREGTNQMAIYAQVTGLTVKQFRELYTANPAQALTAVTEAIGRAGPRGATVLGQLGLDQVRTQRALLELAQSGGLGAQVSMAVGAYGNRSTQAAASAAYGGLLDAGVKLQSSFTELAGVAGAPLLRPFTQFTNLLAAAVHPLSALVASGPVQKVATAAAEFGGIALIARRVLGVGATVATLGQLGTSGIVRGAVAGQLVGRYGLGGAAERAAAGSRMARFAMPVLEAEAAGSLGAGMMGRANVGTYLQAQRLGAFMGPGNGGAPLWRRALGGLGTAASLGFEGGMNISRAPFALASHRFDERSAIAQQLLMGAPGGAFANFGTAVRAGVGARDLDTLRTGFHNLRADLAETGKGARVAGAALAAVGSVGRAGAVGIGKVAGGVGGLAMSAIGLPGLALAAGGIGYELYGHAQSARAAENARFGAMNDPGNSVRNRYNDALGLASENTSTFADVLDASARRVGSAATTMEQALRVNPGDRAAAGGQAQLVRYSGSVGQAASQVAGAFAPGGGKVNPQQMARIKTDLINSGYSDADVNTIAGEAAKLIGVGHITPAVTKAQVGSILSSQNAYHPSDFSFAKFQQAGADLLGPLLGGSSAGEGISPIAINTATRNQIDQLGSDLTAQFNADSASGGPNYAVQQLFRNVNSVMGQIAATGQEDIFAYASKRMSKLVSSLGGQAGGKTSQVGLSDFTAAGGDFVTYLQRHGSNSFGGKPLGYWRAQGAGPGASSLAPTPPNNAIAAQIGTSSPAFAALYTAGATGAMGSAQKLFAAGQQGGFGSPEGTAAAAQAFVNAAVAAGTSASALGNQALAAGAVAPQDQAFLTKVAQLSQLAFAGKLASMSQPAQLNAVAGNAVAGINSLSGVNTPEAQAQVLAYKQTLLDTQDTERSYYQQRLAAQYSYQLSATRSNEDFQRSLGRSQADFALSRSRAAEDAARSMYDPYTRIQVRPVWDAANLIGNRGEQLTALRTQVANIKKLRAMGLSAAAIAQLDLFNPANAMQTSELVGDLAAAHDEVGQLNRQATAVQTAAGQLLSEDPAYKRQAQDYAIALDRQRTEHQIQLGRMTEDLHHADLTITNNLGDLQKAFNSALAGHQVDFSTLMTNSWKSTLADAQHYGPLITAALNSVAAGAGGPGGASAAGGMVAAGGTSGGGYGNAAVAGHGGGSGLPGGKYGGSGSEGAVPNYVNPGTGSVYHHGYRHAGKAGSNDYRPDKAFIKAHPADPDFNRSIARRMAPAWSSGSQWAAWDALWSNESGWSQYADNAGSDAYGIPQSLPGSKMKAKGKDWRTNPATQIAWGIDYIRTHLDDRTGLPYGTPANAWSHEQAEGWYGTGSIFTGPRTIGVGEHGSEAVLPLDRRGAGFLADVLRSYLGADARALAPAMAGGITIEHLHEEHHYDQGQHIHGDVTVKANSPAEWAAQAQAAQRHGNLTAARGVRWSKTRLGG